MADKITQTSTLKLGSYFSDGDTRTIDIPDPIDNITAAQINAVGTVAQTTQVLIGDKGGANFVRFQTAKKITTTRTELDLR